MILANDATQAHRIRGTFITFNAIRLAGPSAIGINTAISTPNPVNVSATAKFAMNQYGGFLKLLFPRQIATKITLFSSMVTKAIRHAIYSATVVFLLVVVLHICSSSWRSNSVPLGILVVLNGTQPSVISMPISVFASKSVLRSVSQFCKVSINATLLRKLVSILSPLSSYVAPFFPGSFYSNVTRGSVLIWKM